MELRKQKEQEFHNVLRNEGLTDSPEFEQYTSNKKWYSISQRSRDAISHWLGRHCAGKRTLDYCCGNGGMSIEMAGLGAAEVMGIDISDVSAENARKYSERAGFGKKIGFMVMDAEHMTFGDNSFDVIQESGALHHLDLKRAYAELARVLKPDGAIICNEALAHNPLIHYYRRKTPLLRTEWEVGHIFHKRDVYLAQNYFDKVEILGFYHLFTLGAVPFRNKAGFSMVLSGLEAIDSIFLKLPVVKWQAWQVVFTLSKPKKEIS